MSEEQPAFNRKAVKPIECLREGWELIKGNYWLFLGIAALGMIIASTAPMAILAGPMMCGIYYCLLRQQRGESIKFEMLFRGFDYFIQSLIASLFMVIPLMVIIIPGYIVFFVFVIAAAPAGGAPPNPNTAWAILGGMGVFYLAIFLVSLVLAVLLFFTFPLIADRKMTGVQAVRTSVRAAVGNLSGVIGLVLLTQLMSMAGSLVCCVGVFFVMPIHFAAVAIAYRKVFPQEVVPERPPSDGPEADYGPVAGADES